MNNSAITPLSNPTALCDYSGSTEPLPITDTYDVVTSLYEDLLANGSIGIPCPGEEVVITLAEVDEVITEENFHELMRMMKLMNSDSHGASNLLDALRQVHAIPMIEEAVNKLEAAA